MNRDLRTLAIGAVLATSVFVPVMWSRDAAHARTAGLYADSLSAAHDTTRRLAIALTVLANGTQAVQRQSIQTAQIRDSLDRALHLERIARTNASVTIAALRAQTTAAVTAHATTADPADTDAIRHTEIRYRQAPYTVEADVSLPRPPALALWTIGITLDTIPLELRMGCSDEMHGARHAFATLLGPSWGTFTLTRVEQSPALCNPAPRPWLASWFSFAGFRERIGVNVGYGAMKAGSQLLLGPQAGVTVRVWP